MELLNRASDKLKTFVNSINETTFQNSTPLSINCSQLPAPGQEGNCTNNPILQHFFKPLNLIQNPVLYWISITSHHTAKEIYEELKTAKGLGRNLPASKKRFNQWDTRVLYVGKMNRNITGRMVVHLGYSTNLNTQGLQLCHWSQKSGLKLQLDYIILPAELVDLTSFFEKILAKELCPLTGKHK